MRLVILAALVSLGFAPVAQATPEQVHLGLPTADPATGLSVLWLDAQPEAAPQVTLDTPSGARTVTGEPVAGPSVGFAYEAKLAELAPSTTYRYHVGDKSFDTTTPAAATAPFRFVALGDMGADANAAATVAKIQELAPDLVLHSGDISYSGGDPTVWAQWFTMVEPVAARVPWVTALGNHEADVEGAGVPVLGSNAVSPTEQAFYKQRFGLPGNELYYSFDWQGAHVVALDTFSSIEIPAEERAWLDADLGAHENATWTIVFLHEPPFSSNAAHGSSARVQQAFVPLFEKHHVALVIAAHDHSYERFTPINGVTYVVSGGGGAGLYTTWRPTLANGSAAHDASRHVLEVNVTTDQITGRYVAVGAGADSGAAAFADAFSIEKASRAPLAGHVSGAIGGRNASAVGLAAALGAVGLVALARARSRRTRGR